MMEPTDATLIKSHLLQLRPWGLKALSCHTCQPTCNHLCHWLCRWTGASVGVLVAFILAANVVIVIGLKLLPPPGRRQAVVPPTKHKEDQPAPAAQPGKQHHQRGLGQKDSPGSEQTSVDGHSSGGLAVAPASSRSLGATAPLEPVSSRSIGGATPGHSDNPEGPEGVVLGFQPITLTFRLVLSMLLNLIVRAMPSLTCSAGL